jgi:hypothetical protein
MMSYIQAVHAFISFWLFCLPVRLSTSAAGCHVERIQPVIQAFSLMPSLTYDVKEPLIVPVSDRLRLLSAVVFHGIGVPKIITLFNDREKIINLLGDQVHFAP